MGTVIRFPNEKRMATGGIGAPPPIGSASIIILPVIRIERHDDSTSDGFEPNPRSTPGRKRRKR